MNNDKTTAPDYSAFKLVEGTSPCRVPAGYLKHQKDWQAEYDMLLPDGVTCGSCVHARRCSLIFGGKDSNTSCQFHPSRFQKVTAPDPSVNV